MKVRIREQKITLQFNATAKQARERITYFKIPNEFIKIILVVVSCHCSIASNA